MEVSEEWVVPASTKPIQILRTLFPGKWRVGGGKRWKGPDFEVYMKGERYYRTDTGLEVVFPKRKHRSHFIDQVLNKMLGGKWKRIEEPLHWISADHDFTVYRSSARGRTVYRRDDTKEVVYVSDSERFYSKP